MCPIIDGLADTNRHILFSHSLEEQRCDFLAGVFPVLRSFEFIDVPNSILLRILFVREKFAI